MADFWSSVGRARPTRNVLDVIQGKVALDANRRREELTAAELAMSSEQLQQMKRQGEYQEMLRKEGETPIAIETLATGFEGGDQGPMFKMVYDMADKAGYIDKTSGGLGVVKKRHLPEIGQLMSDPNFMSKLSRTRIDYWRGQYNQIKSALAEKPTDQKLLAALQQADFGLNQAQGQDAAYQTEMKRQAAEQAELAKETAAEKRAADLAAKKEYARYEASLKPKGTGKKETRTGDQKELDQFIARNPEYEGLSLLDWKKMVKEAETDPVQAAIKIAQSNLSVQVNPSKMGEVVNNILKIMAKRNPKIKELLMDEQIEGKPELTEDVIKIYTDQGMSREEVIEAYNKKYGE